MGLALPRARTARGIAIVSAPPRLATLTLLWRTGALLRAVSSRLRSPLLEPASVGSALHTLRSLLLTSALPSRRTTGASLLLTAASSLSAAVSSGLLTLLAWLRDLRDPTARSRD